MERRPADVSDPAVSTVEENERRLRWLLWLSLTIPGA
jgi:hypothetical protein